MSSKTILLLNTAKRNGIQITVTDGELQLKVAKSGSGGKGIDPALLQEIKDHKAAIIEFLTDQSLTSTRTNATDHPLLPIDKKSIKNIPLSFSQERLWFIDQLEGTTQYHLPAILRLTGNLDQQALEFALQKVVERHQVLRSVIYEAQDQACQRVIDATGFKLSVEDGSAYKDDQEGLLHFINPFITKPFDLTKDFMLRAHLVHLDTSSFLLVVTLHHIASDGWSLPIIIDEVAGLYTSFVEQQPAKLAPLNIQYADFAAWQRHYLQGAVLDKKLQYWKNKLSGVVPLQLPTDYPRPALQSTRGANLFFTIGLSLVTQLQQLSQQQGTTLFMTLLAAFKLLLHRYSGQQDICVGTPIAGRLQEEVENLVGFFVNTLVLRTEVNGADDFLSLLEKVKQTTMDAFEHQEAPFEKIVETVVKERDLGRSPLFQVLFALQNLPAAQQLILPGLTLTSESLENRNAKFDLSFYITETANELQCSVEYCTDLFGEQTITRMMEHYKVLLSAVVQNPGQKLGSIKMLAAAEEQQLLKDFNATATAYPADKSLMELFEEQVNKTPEDIAVIFEDKQLSYKELNEQANQFAHYLLANGVTRESLVPLCVERSTLMLVALFGILKAGAAFVPIDPEYPQDRITDMLEDSAASIIVCSSNTKSRIQTIQPVRLVIFDDIYLECSKQPAHNPKVKLGANQLAYTIYTSGSTGKPKGVMIEHSNVVNLVTFIAGIVKFDASATLLSLTTYSFDIAYLEYFMPLLSGGRLIIASRETSTNGFMLKYAIAAQRPTHLQATPSTWQVLLDEGWMNNENVTMIITGEAVKEEIKNALTGIGEVYNCYGPTETTIFSTVKKLSSAEKVLIGKPIANTTVVIINSQHQLCPVGIAGEICIGGTGLARGYYNRASLTAEKFIDNPFNDLPGNKLYRTGDLGRWLPDGNIECFGRLDDQVKIRGFRIELGEIETVLEQNEFVKQAVVIAMDGNHLGKQLVGYIVPAVGFEVEQMITYLKEKLPAYMVPVLWVQMDSLPLTPNGKINKKALPDPGNIVVTTTFVAPRNEMEAQLQEIWQGLLGVEQVGIHDNFFELGGHSLLAMRLVSSIRKKLQVELAIREMFTHASIASLADFLHQMGKGLALPSIALKKRPNHIPLSFSQERLWFINKLEGSLQYHLPVVLRLKGHLNTAALSQAINAIVGRHEALRTVIGEEDGIAHQLIRNTDDWQLSVVNVAEYDQPSLSIFTQNIIHEPFNLATDFMLRATLLIIDAEEYLLVVTMHHIASDGWSMSVVVKEVVELYAAIDAGRLPLLNTLPVQYADYAIWQRQYLQGDTLQQKISYWKNKLEDVAPLQLPTDFPRPAARSNAGAREAFLISKQITAQLQQLSRQQETTLFMTLLTTFKVLLHRYTGQDDICVGTPVANRTLHEVEELVGFFINTLALRSTLKDAEPFTSVLQQEKLFILEAYEHQDAPFEKIVDAVVKERDLSRTPVFQVMFVFQNIPAIPQLRLGNLVLLREETGNTVSRFDITLTITETPHGLNASFDYSTDLFSATTIQQLVRHFETLLSSIVLSPNQPIGVLPMLCEDEKNKLLLEFNKTDVAYPKDKTIVDLFEEQVVKNPLKIALQSGKEKLTYEEVNMQSNQLANYLRSKGVADHSLVPLCFDRSAGMIVALLGILKAGAAYMPIDPDYPKERIDYMLKDTEATILITNEINSTNLTRYGIELVKIDTDVAITDQPVDNVGLVISSKSLAYVIYTSGSTGKPKGVMIEHQALLDHCFGVIKSADLADCASFALFAPLVFDAGHSLVHTSFILGAQLHVLPKDLLDEGQHLAAYITDESIDCVKIVPSLWLSYSAAGNNILAVKAMIFGGDLFTVSVLDRLAKLKYAGRVYNHYGPTEATIGKTIHKVDLKKQYNNIPIGKPFSNTEIFITNSLHQLVPVNVPGELYIAGDGLARGYLNNPDLTTEKFITNPFHTNGHDKMYKTGDQARWLPDGNIEYLGRIDEQVKIRGFRIEPGEIENVIKESGLVQQSVVQPKEAGSGNKILVAYVVAAGEFNKEPLIDYLKSRLPDYMIPSFWVSMQQLPLTSNGKINRKALPDPEFSQAASDQYVAPRNVMEEMLAATWQELLGVERVGIHDNFFDLGGDSIITIQAVSRARQKGYEFHVGDIFTTQTVAKLAAVIEIKSKMVSPAFGEQQLLMGAAGLLPAQQRYFNKAHENINHFNQAVLLQLDRAVDEKMLARAIHEIVQQHDALRFSFFETGGKWKQVYGDNEALLTIEDLRRASEDQLSTLITDLSSAHQRSLNITQGLLIKAVLVKMPVTETHNRLLIAIHHLAVDGVSWRILLEDIELLFKAFLAGKQPNLGLKTSSYRQWYIQLEQYGNSNNLQKQTAYWEKIVNSYQPLPVDKPFAGAVQSRDRGVKVAQLATEQTRALLQDSSRLYHTDINDILLSALYLTVQNYTGNNTFTIGLEGHGRQHIAPTIDTSRTIGWFTTHYPLLLETFNGGSALEDVIKSVKEQLRQVPDKGLGYGVSRYINGIQSLQTGEPWDIVFNYLGQLDNILTQGNYLKAATESAGAAFDEGYVFSEKIAVTGLVQNGALLMSWNFSKKHYNEETISHLAAAYIINLEKIIAHCTGTKNAGTRYTPSDFGLESVITYPEFDRFLDEPVKDKARRETIESLYPLSGLQQGLLFHALYETGFGTYVHQFGCDLIGIDVNIFIKSWNQVLNNHSILRSSFHHDVFSIPVQTVNAKIDLPIKQLDFCQLAANEQADALAEYKSKDRVKSFDYKTPPLMRLALIRVSEERFKMIWTWHHLLFDGWSLPILMEEFLTTYDALVTGNVAAAVEMDRYEDYIRYIERGNKEEEEEYWRNYLKNVTGNTLLPFINSGNERTKGAGEYKTLSVVMDGADARLVQNFAQQNRITLNTLMQGVWAYLLHQYSGSENVVYGVIVSGRPEDLPLVEKRVGLYINAIPLFTHINANNNIVEWLQGLQHEQVASRKYQYTPLSDIQRWTGIQGDLFDNLLVFDNYPVSKIVADRKWSLQVEHTELHEQNNYPLSIVIINNPDQVVIQFLYNATLINEAYAAAMGRHFQHVLIQVVSKAAINMGDLSILTSYEEEQLLTQFSNPVTASITSNNFNQLFEAQVLKAPGSIALVYKENQLTYQQVNEFANRLAHYLKSRGVSENVLVPVCIEKSFGMMIALLGILKAGGAYVPIDPDFPKERIEYILRDTGAVMVLADTLNRSKLENIPGIEVIELREEMEVLQQQSIENLDLNIDPAHLAYIIYTSGSTGNPKGVMIRHANMMHYLLNDQTKYIDKTRPANAGSFVHLSYTFDASLTAMFMPLLAGKLVVIGSRPPVEAFEDPNLWKYAPYDFLKITPSHLELLQYTLRNESGFLLTDKLVIGGEALNAGHFKYLADNNINTTIVNEYGPTETTVGCTVYSFNAVTDAGTVIGNVSIGKPIDNTQVYIVDKNNKMVPFGVAGEICISGGGVAKGYLNLPGLTADKFIVNPFAGDPGRVMYTSGDLGRWLPDGNIQYMGRIDEQVKLNGYRIEPGEIESVLTSIEGIRNAKAVVKESVGNKKLNAYLQVDKDRLPLVNSYLSLLQNKIAGSGHLNILPNGLPVMSPNLNEVRFLYKEIFEDHCYLKHGISLNEDSCVVDIGANVGFFTIFLNILSKNIKVYSVEPIPYVYDYLVANRKLYNIKGKAFQLAVSDKEGEVDFTWYPQVSIVSGMSEELNKVNEVVRSYIENSKKENFKNDEIDSMLKVKLETRQIRCKTKTLSAIIREENIEKIDLLKVDVENSEHLVMNGILDKDWDKIGSVIIEVHDVNGRLDRISETLKQKGFTTYIEKEEMLSKDDVLYNLFAIREGQSKKLVTLGSNDEERAVEWTDPAVLIEHAKKVMQERLPAYMIPSNMVLLDEFPLTRNGKIDKKALKEIEENGVTGEQFIAPRNELEDKLAEIWMKVLEIDQVGVQDDFFTLGGDSLLSIRLVSSIRRELDVELAISAFFELITIEKVANYIKVNQAGFPVQLENYEEIKL